MKKNLLFILFLLVLSVGYAQKRNKFYPGTLYFNDNTKKEGLIRIPSEADDKQIQFKKTENDGKESFKSADLKSFKIKTDGGQVEFVNTFYYNIGTAKKSKHSGWFNILRSGYVTLFSNNYDDFSGNELFHPAGSHNIVFLLKRKNEDLPTVVGLYFPSSVNHNQIFRKYTAAYFSDYPDLAKRLESKEFKLDDIGKVVDIYNKWKQK